jgi:hypothetical protein
MKRGRRNILKAFLGAVAVFRAVASQDVEFLRGDVNGDKFVSLADAHYLERYLWNGGTPPPCLIAADADDNGCIMLDDAVLVYNTFTRGAVIPPPFPEPGLDTTPNESPFVDCKDYGTGKPLPLPGAKLAVLNATCRGGTDSVAVLTITLSSTRAVAGYRGTIRLDGIIANFAGRNNAQTPQVGVPDDLTGTIVDPTFPAANDIKNWLAFVRVNATELRFGLWRAPPWVEAPIPAGEDVPVLEIPVCLADGVRAGEYPIALLIGEIVDDATGRAVNPLLTSGSLLVLEDIREGFGCPVKGPIQCPPPVGDTQEAVGTLSLGEAVALPGDSLSVPISVFANGDIQAYGFSVDFDEEILEASGADFTYEKPDGTSYEYSYFDINSLNEIPGSGGVDEGYLVGGAVFSFSDNCNNIPAFSKTEPCVLHFTVRPDVEPGTTALRFVDSLEGPSPRGNSFMRLIFGWTLTLDSLVRLGATDGTVYITDATSRFRRGDSNADGRFDISDSIKTLGLLFLGNEHTLCRDALDVNDDARVDISDAVFALNRLFLGGLEPPAPGPNACGPDPTQDGLGPCAYDTNLCV